MPNKFIRNCIVCGSENATDVFSYSFEFMVGVRGTSPELLRAKGLSEGGISTIVKCDVCGCNYIKDVEIDYQTASAREFDVNKAPKKPLEERLRNISNIFTSKRIDNNLRLLKIFENAVRQVRAAGAAEIKVLDFGAGSAGFSNLAKVTGADLVVAYDLGYEDYIQDVFDTACANGIRATNDLSEVESHAPYNIIFCQSMIEHVTDPRAILDHLQQYLDDDGIVYINNPIMNIDREISQLRAAAKIGKKDQISYYHPGHLNYMMPVHFIRMYGDAGFKASRVYPEPFVKPKGAGAVEVLMRRTFHQLKRAIIYLRPDYPRACFFLTKQTLSMQSRSS